MATRSHGGQPPEETRRHYAQSQGVSEDDPRVRRYAGEPTEDTSRRYEEEDEEETQRPDLDEMDPRVREAAEKYAASQGVSMDDERVIKYVRGLTGRTGDFGGREQESPIGWRQK